MFFVFLNIDQQDELREHGESNFKTLASLRPHYTIGKVYAYVPTYTHYCFVRNTFRNKNECEIHSKVIVSQDYFDY